MQLQTFPNLLELSFLRVRAFPNASNMGFVLRTFCSNSPTSTLSTAIFVGLTSPGRLLAVIFARYAMITWNSGEKEESHDKKKFPKKDWSRVFSLRQQKDVGSKSFEDNLYTFVASVFPAPDSPEMMMDWSRALDLELLAIKKVYAASANTNKWGGSSPCIDI